MNDLIRKYHIQQLRYDRGDYLPPKILYIDHLIGAATILSSVLLKFGECRDQQLRDDIHNAALGHELLEETDVTDDEVIAATNFRVLTLIKELTPYADGEDINQLVQCLSAASEEARLIKYADLIESVSNVCFNFHVVGKEWAYGFFRPTIYSTMGVLDQTEFSTYPKTADFMRGVLAVCMNLLNAKSRTVGFQYPTKALKTTKEAISDKALTDIIDDSYTGFRTLCMEWRRGKLTDFGLENGFLEIVREGMDKFFKTSHLLNRLKWTDNNSWERFLDDYLRWKDGEEPISEKGEIWLACRDEQIPDGIKCGEEASYFDKIRFFELMEAFQIPVEYYMPLPAGTICPDKHPGHHPSDLIVGWRIWEDDDGLLSDNFQIGNTIVLTDHYGLKSTIKVTEHLVTDEEKRKRRILAEYIGMGNIEGYTAAREREIHIILEDGKILYLSTVLDHDDQAVYNNFALWKDAREHLHSFYKVQSEVAASLVKLFMKEEENK